MLNPEPGRGPDLPDPSRILIIRPSALGDVCRSVPVLVSLRRAYPQAQIDWLVQDSFRDAVWYHPALTNAVAFPRRQLSDDLKRLRVRRVVGWMNRTLREPGYDLVLDCQGLGRSGLFALWTGAPVRIGYARPEGRELSWLGVNRRVRVPLLGAASPRSSVAGTAASRTASSGAPGGVHAVDRMLELVKAAGVEPVRDMRLYTGPKERAFVEKRVGTGRYAVLAPTSRWAGKLWPVDRYAEVTRWLLEHGVETVVLVGAEHERSQCVPLLELAASEPRVADLIGGTSVGELMAVIQGAALVVASDSASLHMAVGFGRPVIGLYGPTRVDLVGPYPGAGGGASCVVLQHVRAGERQDHKDQREGCEQMSRISSAEVVRAAERLLAASP